MPCPAECPYYDCCCLAKLRPLGAGASGVGGVGGGGRAAGALQGGTKVRTNLANCHMLIVKNAIRT